MAKPIRSLRFAFDAASAERLDYRVAPLMGRRQDELADLGRAFDRMVERLQASMDRQRRLLHDVSHEVRSPLARLQAAAGLLRQRQSTEETTVERIEAGELAEEVQDVDLHELVAQIVSDANFEAQSSGRTVTWMEGSAASMRARPEMLHVAFENIVRNALKHAPDSPLVRIETSVDAVRSRYTFRVEDSGPGVRSDELATLFTPFFRAAGAAAADGYGLGLAIARRSIEAHGGAIRAQNLPAGGLAVEIVLPLNEDPATLDV